MAGHIIRIAVIMILIVLSAFFSSMETALTTISPHRLRAMVEGGVKRAGVLKRVLSRKDRMLSTILVGNNIVNISASALASVFVQDLFGKVAVSIGTGILTVLILIFGEVAPKTMATYRAEKIALRYCGIINVIMTVLYPLVAAISLLSGGVLRLLGIKKGEKNRQITEQELRTIVKASHEEGLLEEEEKEIINNIFDFAGTVVREVMVPRINIVSINLNSTYEDLMQAFKDNYYTRIPVFDENNEKIVGVINVKDLMFRNEEEEFRLENVMRDTEYTFENKHISELFLEMQRNHLTMMVVLDEYGDTAGIVTFEDLLEEIVGEIRDEYDEDEAEEIVKIGENEYTVYGHISIDDINDRLGIRLESEDYDSIGGLIIEKLGDLPSEGDVVVSDNITITTLKTDGTRIELVKIEVGPEQE
ncbi:MAG: HlyC/CorC family transporter [Lachnospiraceae bacterium]|jgi:putative hemolysin